MVNDENNFVFLSFLCFSQCDENEINNKTEQNKKLFDDKLIKYYFRIPDGCAEFPKPMLNAWGANKPPPDT